MIRLDGYGAERQVLWTTTEYRTDRLRVDGKDPLLLYAWSQSGSRAEVSSDGGVNWSPFGGLPENFWIRCLEVDPENVGHAFLGAYSGLYKTTDRGLTWHQLASYQVQAFAIAPSDAKVMILSAAEGVYKSADGGLTWQKLAVPPAPEVSVFSTALTLLIDPRNPNVFYVGSSKSEDGGQSWVRMVPAQSWPYLELLVQAIDPTDTDVLYAQHPHAAGENNGVFRSTDGGASWSPQNDGLPVPDVSQIVGDPHSSGVYATTRAGLYRLVRSPASWLHFPYMREDNYSFTGIAVSNFSASENRLTFLAYDGEGRQAQLAENPASEVLGEHQQVARLVHEIFAQQDGELDGWVSARGDFNSGGFFLLAGDKWADGAIAETEDSNVLHFAVHGPDAFPGQGAETTLVLVNPADQQIKVWLNWQAAGGDPIQRVSRTIPPKGRLVEGINSLFTGSVTEGYIRAESGDFNMGVMGFELVRFPAQQSALALNAFRGSSLGRLYSAQLAQMGGTRTRIKLINTSGESMKVRVRAVAESGGLLAPEVETTLEPRACFEKDAGELFGFSQTADVVGSLEVIPDRTGLIGDVVFGELATLRKIAALPLQTEALRKMVFSQVANGMGYYNGLAMFNPGAVANQVTISVYSAEGVLTGETQLTLPPGGRLARLLP